MGNVRLRSKNYYQRRFHVLMQFFLIFSILSLSWLATGIFSGQNILDDATITESSNPDIEWIRRWSTTNDDEANAVCIDSQQNILMVGT